MRASSDLWAGKQPLGNITAVFTPWKVLVRGWRSGACLEPEDSASDHRHSLGHWKAWSSGSAGVSEVCQPGPAWQRAAVGAGAGPSDARA